MGSILSRSALLTGALLSGFVVPARPSLAESLLHQFQQNKQIVKIERQAGDTAVAENAESEGAAAEASSIKTGTTISVTKTDSAGEKEPLTYTSYIATAYSLRGLTASGQSVTKGIIAADLRILPLGSRVRLQAGIYSGEYIVADTGRTIRGKKIDIWTPTAREALKFGRRNVKLTVLRHGRKGAVTGSGLMFRWD